MSAPLQLSDTANLIGALVLGISFGFFLERGGLGNPHRLTGVFYLTDFAVPKAMFTAIVVAATGVCLLTDLNVLDMDAVYIIPTFFWPQLVGGALFGIGYILSGYCPGTAVAGLASGRLDALAAMVGIGLGTVLFAVVFPQIQGFYMISSMGKVTLPVLIGINKWTMLAIVYVLAGAMFYAMERFEQGRSPAGIMQHRHA